MTPLGSNRDRHAMLGEGELGEEGLAVFLSEPRFDDAARACSRPDPDRRRRVAADDVDARPRSCASAASGARAGSTGRVAPDRSSDAER